MILQGDNSIGEFYSIALTNKAQQADTGTKMVHIGKNTRSTIISKGISAGKGQNSYRGLVQVGKKASKARNFSQCDSLLIGDNAERIPFLTLKQKIQQLESNMRQQLQKLEKTRFFTAINVALKHKMPSI